MTATADDELAALLAEVYASPDEDAPRQVYADALIARGDPRGEYVSIALAFARTRDETLRTRRDALERELDREALSHGLARYAEVDYERGFPDSIIPKRLLDARLLELPALATLTGLGGLSHHDASDVLALCDHPALQRITGLTSMTWAQLARVLTRPRAWTYLSIRSDDDDVVREVPSRGAYANLPALETLLVDLEGTGVLPSHAVAIPSLRTLEIDAERTSIPALELPPLRALTLRGQLPQLTLAAPIDQVTLRTMTVDAAALAMFAGVRALHLGVTTTYADDTFAALGSIESLTVDVGGVGARSLLPLTRLRELSLVFLDTPIDLAGLPIEVLRWPIVAPLAWISPSPQLRELHISYPFDDPDAVGALVRRLPPRASLHVRATFRLRHRDPVLTPEAVAAMRAVFERSTLARLALEYYVPSADEEGEIEGRELVLAR